MSRLGHSRRCRWRLRSIAPVSLALAFLAALLGPTLAQAAEPGDLDRSFSRNGKVVTNLGAVDGARSVAVDPQGRVVAAGYTYSATEDEYGLVLTRYKQDGSLDRSFSGDGKVETDFGVPYGEEARAVAIDRHGRIVATGALNPDFPEGFALARYKPNGELDSSFGNGGKVTLHFGGRGERANALAIDSHGRIVLAGEAVYLSSLGWNTDIALARYKPNGELDSSFNGDGRLTTDLGPFEEARSMAIDSQDRIVVAGSGAPEFVVARYKPNGELDPSFGSGGLVTSADLYGNSVAIDSDGRIVVAGNENRPNFALARLESSGNPDASFSGSGTVTTSFWKARAIANSVAVDSRGRIVAAGVAYGRGHSTSDFALARYSPNGSLDRSFSGNGRVRTDFKRGDIDEAYSVSIDSEDRIVAAGRDTGDFAVARYIGYPKH